MAVSRERIEYDYREMLELSARISRAVSELENIKQGLDGSLSELSGYWKGDSAQDYMGQGQDVSNLMQKNIQYLRSIASGIKKTATVYREAEYAKIGKNE